MLSVIILNVIMLNVFMLNVIMLSVTFSYYFAKCYLLIYKTSCLNEEVKCTEPFPRLAFPA